MRVRFGLFVGSLMSDPRFAIVIAVLYIISWKIGLHYNGILTIITLSVISWHWEGTDRWNASHYNDVITGAIASQITSLTIVYWTIFSDVEQRKHQSSASLAFVRGIHRGPVNSPHKWPVTWKMSPFDDVIMFMETKELLFMYSKYCGCWWPGNARN